MEQKKLLKNNSSLKCDKGTLNSNFKISKKQMSVNGNLIANTEDGIAGENIFSFGQCKIISKECQIDKSLSGNKLEWINSTKGIKVAGNSQLSTDSVCLCPLGGEIKFMAEDGAEAGEGTGEEAEAEEKAETNIEKNPFDIMIEKDIDKKIKNLNQDEKERYAVNYISSSIEKVEDKMSLKVSEAFKLGIMSGIKNAQLNHRVSATSMSRMRKREEKKGYYYSPDYMTSLDTSKINMGNAEKFGKQLTSGVFNFLNINNEKINFYG